MYVVYPTLLFYYFYIEVSAEKLGVTATEMRRRLERTGLMKDLIRDCYDTLHTESRKAVAEDVVEALLNREKDRRE
jgi:hypothetical protein